MKTLRRSYWLLVAAVLCGLPASLAAQEARRDSSTPDSAVSRFDSRQGRTVGAPQVIEIPPRDLTPPPLGDSQSELVPTAIPEGLPETTDIVDGGIRHTPALSTLPKRNYLGVLYATAEEGPVGIKVLDVVEGSPAARAGFQGVNAPTSQRSDLFKAAIVVLAMSPAGPFAIPLAIAHDMYMNRQSPGDLIVAVNDHPVRDAQEFSEEMRRYQPGETVSFSVMRGGKPVQISVQLEEEPV